MNLAGPWLPIAALAGAAAVDRLLGELPGAAHPVVWIGRAVRAFERIAPQRGPGRQLLWGAIATLAIPAAAAALAAAALALAARAAAAAGPTWAPWLLLAVEVALLKPTFAIRALGDAARRVRDALAAGRLDEARAGLRSLCSRDPSHLDAPAVASAAVASVAENASDSIVAPLCYYALFGLPGAVFYRAVNTMDAMIGYRGRYEYLGKPAARLDDLLNLIPARLTALLLLGAGGLRALGARLAGTAPGQPSGADVRRGAAILVRDGGQTESPNGGRPMAAMAGLLGIELAKVGHYRLGDPGPAAGPDTIDRAWRLVATAALLALLLAAAAIAALARCPLGWS